MQPRLVAISYPSASRESEAETNKTKRFSRLTPFKRAKSEADAYTDLHARLSRKLRRFTWHDIKSQVTLSRRKRSTLNEDDIFEPVQPWSEAFLNDSGFESTIHVDAKRTSQWQALPSSIQADIIKCIEATYRHLPSANTYSLRRKDVMAFQLSCRAWSKTAQRRLYETIQLKPNYDYDWSTTPPKIRHTRLLQFRRTLRTNPELADLVKHLMLLPEAQDHEKQQIVYSDLVATIVMACPNLESLTSFHVPYTHAFDRLHHALATRTELKKHTWIIGEDHFVRSRAGRRHSAGILSSQQTRLFLHYHALWKNLEEINIISHNGKGILEHNLFVKTLNMLPSLKRLHISSFDANDFSDETLLSLPPLTSLRLDRCTGVTEMGLCHWAESPAAANIQRLVLESQHITSLLTIAALFSVLPKLEIFRMVQLEFEPSLPLELDVKQPLLSSDSLQKFEWFVACGWDPEIHKYSETSSPEKLHDQLQTWSHSKATQQILSSILEYGFPSLKYVLLPGYGNLSGLLRWVRHTSPATQEEDSTPQQRPTMPKAPHSAPLVRLRRNGSRLSLRPASPSFQEYDHWRKTPLFDVPESSRTTIVEPPSPVSPISEEEKASAMFAPDRPISAITTPLDMPSTGQSYISYDHGNNHIDDINESDEDCDDESDDESISSESTASDPGTPSAPSPATSPESIEQNLSRSSSTTLRPTTSDSYELPLDPVTKPAKEGLRVRFDLDSFDFGFEDDEKNKSPVKFSLPDEISRIGRNSVPGWALSEEGDNDNENDIAGRQAHRDHLQKLLLKQEIKKDVMMTMMKQEAMMKTMMKKKKSDDAINEGKNKGTNRHSSISILLDGYAYTA